MDGQLVSYRSSTYFDQFRCFYDFLLTCCFLLFFNNDFTVFSAILLFPKLEFTDAQPPFSRSP